MNPLSITKYYFRNKRKIFPLLLIIIFSILNTTASAALTGSLYDSIRKRLPFYENYSQIISRKSDTEGLTNLAREIKSFDEVEDAILVRQSAIMIDNIFGQSDSSFIFFVDKSKLNSIVSSLDFEVIEGRLPESGSEIAVSEDILKNKNLTIGQSIESNGIYQIVGKIKYKEVTGAVGINDSETYSTLLISPKAGMENTLSDKLKKATTGNKDLLFYDKFNVKEAIEKQTATIDKIVWTLNFITAAVTTFCIGLLNIIFFMQRSNEFGLLAALGYSKNFIILKTIKESLGIILLGWALGLLFSEGIYTLINSQIFDPKGMPGLTILDWRVFIFSIPIPLAMFIFSTTTVLWKLNRMDPIAIIEKRD